VADIKGLIILFLSAQIRLDPIGMSHEKPSKFHHLRRPLSP